ncbi:MAG: M28 family peptidase [Nannocystaceae bacterium]
MPPARRPVPGRALADRRRRSSPRGGAGRVAGLVVAVAIGLACGDPAGPEPAGCPAPLATVIDADALLAHLDALAAIAVESGGNRAAGRDGYARSLDHAESTLREAGYAVTRQTFDFLDYELVSPPILAELAPEAVDYAPDAEFRAARFSASGDVSGPVVAVDLSLEAASASTSGCTADDFAGFPAGGVALIQRGGCSFDAKVQAAADAGAVAVVMLNQGDDAYRSGVFSPRLGAGAPLPTVGVSFALGSSFAARIAGGLVLRVAVDGVEVPRIGENLLAETPTTPSGVVLMLGAHLDSVVMGPGINDNGSGVASVLEVARALSPCDLRHQVRLGLWGAEELGLLGSSHYVESLGDDERAAIAFYLNLDMVASPNPARFLYDGDGSAFGVEGRRARRSSRRRSPASTPSRRSRPGRPPSTGAPTTGPSSTAGSRPAGSSPAPRGS